MKTLNKKKTSFISMGLLLFAYGLACFYLYYMQSIQVMDVNNKYFESDLPYHISMIIDDGWHYSFTAYIYQVLHWLAGGATHLIAAFLSVVTVWNVLLTDKLFRLLQDKPKMDGSTLAAALILNMVMPCFMEKVGIYRYCSYQSGNVWHNSTYLSMKLLSLLSMILFIQMEKEYREKITWKQWAIFAGVLVICTGVKPSFLTIFAPAFAVKLLWDLAHKVRFKQIFIFGSTVLPSCGVILWQNAVLFGEETGQGFAINPWFTFSKLANSPKLAVICSIAFPLVVLMCSLPELWKNRNYFFGWMMTGVGFLEAVLLAETGSRSRDGNFLWGYYFGIFYIFVLSLKEWLKMWDKGKEKKIYKVLFFLAGLVLFYHLFCGVHFFLRLLSGETYFMYS